MTVSDIAREVGCVQASVYRYIDKLFPNLSMLPACGIPAAESRLPSAKAEAVINAMRWAGLGPAEKAPGPKVEELAKKLGVPKATLYKFAKELCPGRNVRLTPAEVAAITKKVKNTGSSSEPSFSRAAKAPANSCTITELAKKLGVPRATLSNAVFRIFPSKRTPRIRVGEIRPAILITADEADAVKAEVARVQALGRRSLSPNDQRRPRSPNGQRRPPLKKSKPVSIRDLFKGEKLGGFVPPDPPPDPELPPSVETPPIPFTDPMDDDLPPIEDVVMSVLEEQPSMATPARRISFENLARAFKWDPDDLRCMVYTKFPGMLGVPGEPSTALTPNELLDCVLTGLPSAQNGEPLVQR